ITITASSTTSGDDNVDVPFVMNFFDKDDASVPTMTCTADDTSVTVTATGACTTGSSTGSGFSGTCGFTASFPGAPSPGQTTTVNCQITNSDGAVGSSTCAQSIVVIGEQMFCALRLCVSRPAAWLCCADSSPTCSAVTPSITGTASSTTSGDDNVDVPFVMNFFDKDDASVPTMTCTADDTSVTVTATGACTTGSSTGSGFSGTCGFTASFPGAPSPGQTTTVNCQ